ncbi:IucA/IucC family protein [Flocculibacter collagenilyticus]|uniref:IucA/IucC family protein n=1 Tax=Flocculibacter collagenilyticus TaxID=2744479 RepID=UPI0018F34AC0|nr:IucA/IucC family protein [Flocculibacter collagenilyticus]
MTLSANTFAVNPTADFQPSQHQWLQANKKLTAKILSELHFEERLTFTEKSNKDGKQYWQLSTPHRDWTFSATISIWGMFIIDPHSISLSDGLLPDACVLLLDIQDTILISEHILAGLLEEIQQTLFSDTVQLANLAKTTATELVSINEVERQPFLDAHPKAIANKGRLGWGENELAQYAPESNNTFGLHYLAVKKSACQAGIKTGLAQRELLKASMTDDAYNTLMHRLTQQLNTFPTTNSTAENYLIMAAHPWQVSRFLKAQFATLLASGALIDLGAVTSSDNQWQPQLSIRTLSSTNPTIKYDMKTALTILNTSCYRGITGHFIVQGPQLSAWLHQLTQSDRLFKTLGLKVQQEEAGIFCAHPYQSQLDGADYRYKEMLGCIWRERAESLITNQQRVMSMATLTQTDSHGNSCLLALIESANCQPEQWIRAMFRHVVIPLYHLMCQYGVALVAHGQNITLILENNMPVGCTIKDFHGDLRLIDNDFAELSSLDDEIKSHLTRLPAHYLIHDLLTGHFVSLLRFVSPHLTADASSNTTLTEQDFYDWLADEIIQYQAQHPHLANRFAMFNLFTPTIDKICINRVRFKIGYGDSSERPLPEIGEPIPNPLFKFAAHYADQSLVPIKEENNA